MALDVWFTAAAWLALAILASVISIRLAVSVALVEIVVGAVAGNVLGLHATPWIDVLAGYGSVLLTFLAGAEIDPDVLRARFKESVAIGFTSFLLPFLGAMAYAYWVAGWSADAAKIAGVALSTTSVAVVYAVMVEGGLNQTELGKVILAACFVTDLGTVLALGVLFAAFDARLLLFATTLVAALFVVPRLTRWYFARFGNVVSEPEVKYVLALLAALGGLAVSVRSEAVLPAYVIGLALARQFMANRELLHRMRTLAFAFLTPFYFIKAGALVSAKALASSVLLVAAMLLVKMVAKLAGVWPVALAFGFGPRRSAYTTLLMATGLTFGTISALFGFTHGYVDRAQYTALVTVVILSAVVPTLIAQAFFRPTREEVELPSPVRTDLAVEPGEG